MIKLIINNLTFEFRLYNELEELAKFDSGFKNNLACKTITRPCSKGECDQERLIFGVREEENCGLTYRSKDKVYINRNLPKDLMLSTILHEVTHCYMWAYGFTQYRQFEEEHICDFIGAFGPQLVKDSNLIFSELTKELKKESK